MDLLQKDFPSLTKIYEAKCFYDSQNNRIILYYKNHVTARTLVDFYNLPTTPPPNSSLYVIYDLQTGTFNVSTNPPTYTVSNSKVYVTSPINAEYDMDKVIIYRISWYETSTAADLDHILGQLNTIDTDLNDIHTRLNTIDTDLNDIRTQLTSDTRLNDILAQLNTFVRKQQADTITATHTFDPTEPGPAFQLGPNAQNQLIQYLNADKVDGFDASQTPAPNTIPVALSNGKLDLGWFPDSLQEGGYRRIDLTNATTDYDLQLGEEAYIVWDTTASLTCPLRIKVSGSLYELFISVPQRASSTSTNNIYLSPNNSTGSFNLIYSYLGVIRDINNNAQPAFLYYSEGRSSIILPNLGIGGVAKCLLQTTTQNKKGLYFVTNHTSVYQATTGSFVWNDTISVWYWLGTLQITTANGTIYVLVRRIL